MIRIRRPDTFGVWRRKLRLCHAPKHRESCCRDGKKSQPSLHDFSLCQRGLG